MPIAIHEKKEFINLNPCSIFAHGEMAEWSNAAVLKTAVLHGTGGSNPSFSAKQKTSAKAEVFFFLARP